MYQYEAKVSKVVDGDTIHAVVDLGFKIYTDIIFRLARINAPERNTPEGVIVKAILVEKLFGKEITIDCNGKDRYGRWIATITLGTVEINQWLLDNNYATVYLG